MGEEPYDVIILGAGPAGLTAALYAARFKMKALVLGEMQGGTITEAHKVENWPGTKTISGMELGQQFVGQVKALGVEMKMDNAAHIKKSVDLFEVETTRESYRAKKLIVAVGTKRRELGLEREKELKGKGVSYCAACDASFFAGKKAAVVGGGNSALSAAQLLAEASEKVYIIYRREKFFRAEPVQIDSVMNNKKIEKIFNSKVVKLEGEEKLERIVLDDGKELEVDGLFVEVGEEARKDLLHEIKIELDESGYIVSDKEMRTSVEGVYSAGDTNAGNFKQAVVASGEGAIAARSAFLDLKKEASKADK